MYIHCGMLLLMTKWTLSNQCWNWKPIWNVSTSLVTLFSMIFHFVFVIFTILVPSVLWWSNSTSNVTIFTWKSPCTI
jgi:hypothetical protein